MLTIERYVRSQSLTNGAPDVQVVELPDAIKTVLVQWKSVNIDLNELARLRWIKKMTIAEICTHFGKRRSTIQVSIRTLRNCGVSQLILTDFEKNSVMIAINEEIQKLIQNQRKFNIQSIAHN